jgi:molybdopterin converting factor small subunit
MRVAVKYLAQVKQAAGCTSEAVEVDAGCSLRGLVRRLAERHGEPLCGLLLGPTGTPHDSLLVFLGDEQVRWEAARDLRDGDVITVLAPMAGG